MPPVLATLLFWSAVVAVLAAQWAILRSTARAWQHAGGKVPVMERIFAFGPALVIVLVLFLSWRAATRPQVFQVDLAPSPTSLRL